MKVPGWVIGLILVLLQAALEFLQGEQFAGLDWAPFVALSLTTAISAIKLGMAQKSGIARASWGIRSFSEWWFKG